MEYHQAFVGLFGMLFLLLTFRKRISTLRSREFKKRILVLAGLTHILCPLPNQQFQSQICCRAESEWIPINPIITNTDIRDSELEILDAFLADCSSQTNLPLKGSKALKQLGEDLLSIWNIRLFGWFPTTKATASCYWQTRVVLVCKFYAAWSTIRLDRTHLALHFWNPDQRALSRLTRQLNQSPLFQNDALSQRKLLDYIYDLKKIFVPQLEDEDAHD